MENLVKNSVHSVTINGYSHDGAGIARINGQVVFVKNALDGEVCLVKILKVTKNTAYAKIEQILSPSPHRIAPACPSFGKCGGCTLMHMDYDEELRFKQDRVQDALKRLGGLDITLSGIIGADKESVMNYRNKAVFAVAKDNFGKTVTGFFRQRSHDIIPADTCFIQSEQANRAATAVRTWMNKYNVDAYDEQRHTGTVRHVFCRYGKVSGELQVVVISFKKKLPYIDELINEILSSCPETASIILNVNKSEGNTILCGDFITLWGNSYIDDVLCGLKYSLSPLAFYQINHDQAEKLYNITVSYASLTGSETVLDLYCGTGTITLCLARYAKKVIGAEIVEAAIINARQNAEQNGVKNTEFICADAAKAAADFRSSGITPDVIVVDPPRKGLAADVVESIAGMKPERIVYVSCDPATLARDLKIFASIGYCTIKAEAVDMFPRTSHVETVVLMSRVDK